MISNHDDSTYAHWVILGLWVLAAALFVLSYVRWRRGRWIWGLPATGAVLILIASVWMLSVSHLRLDASARQDASADGLAQTARVTKQLSPESQTVMDIVVKRCQACHSDHATMMSFAAFGLSLNTMQDINDNASQIYREVVELQQMPMGNATHMTDDERATIARWYASRRH